MNKPALCRCYRPPGARAAARLAALLALVLAGTGALCAQGKVSGNLVSNNQFFVRDTTIGAAGTPQYDRQLFGADAWFDLRYQDAKGLRAGLRFDMFLNSNLLNPTGSYNAQGIGRWFVRKRFGPLDIEGGYLYHQVGSGIIFRSYEQRALAIDNALYGVRATYNFSDDWSVTGFAGRQKQQFELYESNVRGAHVEGYSTLGDTTGRLSVAPGFGVVARTLDDNSMNLLVSTLNTYPAQDTFTPNYNTYALTAYNTLNIGPWSWYVEGAYKTPDAQTDPEGIFRRDIGGEVIESTDEKIFEADGSVVYSSLGYAAKGLGLSFEYKRTENFFWRTRPQATLNQGFIGFLPPMTRINTYRLTARYNAATQELAEQAFQVNAAYRVNKKLRLQANYSHIDRFTDSRKLWRETNVMADYKLSRTDKFIFGLQRVFYDQELYETKPGAPPVQTITPFAEWLHKFSRRRALRTEAQVLVTDEDLGSWVFGLAEFTIAPHWTFSASDMYLFDPSDETADTQHYPRFDIFYAWGANRVSASYIKQVEGVVCSGGICRLEPAFSGWRVSTFFQF